MFSGHASEGQSSEVSTANGGNTCDPEIDVKSMSDWTVFTMKTASLRPMRCAVLCRATSCT